MVRGRNLKILVVLVTVGSGLFWDFLVELLLSETVVLHSVMGLFCPVLGLFLGTVSCRFGAVLCTVLDLFFGTV